MHETQPKFTTYPDLSNPDMPISGPVSCDDIQLKRDSSRDVARIFIVGRLKPWSPRLIALVLTLVYRSPCLSHKMLSYRRETALQGALEFSPKVEDSNWETIFYRQAAKL